MLVPCYVPDTSTSTFVGYGAAIGIPTATERSLGSGKWTAGPAMLVARTGYPMTYGALVQHVWSVAGDEDRGDVSASTFQPFATYLLGGGWSATVLSEMTYDWESESWTVPVNLGISRVVTIGGRFVSVGLTGVTYIEAPEYAPEWEVRAGLTYMFR